LYFSYSCTVLHRRRHSFPTRRSADLFVAVGLGGVDVAVADLHGVTHSLGDRVVVDEPGAEAQLGDLDSACQRVGLVQYGHAPSPFWGSRSYSSSETGSSHSLSMSSPGVMKARWENHASPFAPCQCFVPAGTRITVPGTMLTGSSPSAWYQPEPAVHMRI